MGNNHEEWGGYERQDDIIWTHPPGAINWQSEYDFWQWKTP
jgi:hypothetical protein